MSDQASAEFRAGSVLGQSFRVLGSNLPAFLTISLLLVAPVYLFLAWGAWEEDFLLSLPDAVFQYGVIIAETLLGFVAHAAVVYGTFRQLQGRRVSFVANVAGGLGKVLPVVFVAIAAGLLAMLGFLFFIIPGLIVLTMYWVAVPAAVVEDTGVGASLNRSAKLTEGCRWKVFGVIFVVIVIQSTAERVVENVLDFDSYYYLSLGVAWLISGATIALEAVLSTVTYRELRRVKEGTGIDEIAAVFD